MVYSFWKVYGFIICYSDITSYIHQKISKVTKQQAPSFRLKDIIYHSYSTIISIRPNGRDNVGFRARAAAQRPFWNVTILLSTEVFALSLNIQRCCHCGPDIMGYKSPYEPHNSYVKSPCKKIKWILLYNKRCTLGPSLAWSSNFIKELRIMYSYIPIAWFYQSPACNFFSSPLFPHYLVRCLPIELVI